MQRRRLSITFAIPHSNGVRVREGSTSGRETALASMCASLRPRQLLPSAASPPMLTEYHPAGDPPAGISGGHGEVPRGFYGYRLASPRTNAGGDQGVEHHRLSAELQSSGHDSQLSHALLKKSCPQMKNSRFSIKADPETSDRFRRLTLLWNREPSGKRANYFGFDDRMCKILRFAIIFAVFIGKLVRVECRSVYS